MTVSFSNEGHDGCGQDTGHCNENHNHLSLATCNHARGSHWYDIGTKGHNKVVNSCVEPLIRRKELVEDPVPHLQQATCRTEAYYDTSQGQDCRAWEEEHRQTC